MPDWDDISLGDVVTHQKGFAFKSKDYQKAGVPVVRVSNFTSDSIDVSDLYFVSEGVAKENRNVELQANDIVIATVGSWPSNPASIVGKTIRVPQVANGTLLNQNAVRLRVKDSNPDDQVFLYYVLKKPEFINYLVSTAQGSANQASITLKDIFNYSFEWPGKNERKVIGEFFDAIDKKIQLNSQINRNLDQITQTIFKSWFVDFEPVKAKIQAKQNCQDPERAAMRTISGKNDEGLDQLSSKQSQHLANTATFFPYEMEETDMGEFPKGWLATKYGDLYIEKKEKVRTREDVSVLSAVQSGELKLPADVFDKQVHSKDISKYKLVNVGDLSYNPSRINIGSAGFNEFNFVGAVSTVYTVMGLKDQAYGAFARMHLKLGLTKEWINILCSGSVRQSLSADDFLSIPVFLPGTELIEEFSKIYQSFDKQINANKEENRTLESIRDLLLPKLLSGEIAFDDTHSIAEAVIG